MPALIDATGFGPEAPAVEPRQSHEFLCGCCFLIKPVDPQLIGEAPNGYGLCIDCEVTGATTAVVQQ